MADSIAGVSYDVDVLAKQIELQNEAINQAVNMSLAANSRCKVLSMCIDEMLNEIVELEDSVRVWRTTVVILACFIFVGIVFWTFGLV